MGTFERAVEWVNFFHGKGTQRDVSLCGLGEPLLHPNFKEFTSYIRKNFAGDIHFGTNGILLTEEIARHLAELRIGIYVSLHRPELAANAVNLGREYGILLGVNAGFAISSFNWAGQVDWPVTAPKIDCEYLKQGWGTILQDGKITTCCMDTEDKNIIGHIDDIIGTVRTSPGILCKGCHHNVPTVSELKEQGISVMTKHQNLLIGTWGE